jgi:hypothetical protein
MPTIPKVYHLEQTMPQSHHASIHEQCCGFSMDRVAKANFECLSVAFHLPDNLSASCQQWKK